MQILKRRVAQQLRILIRSKDINIYVPALQLSSGSRSRRLIITSEIQGLHIRRLQEDKLGLMEF